MKKPMHVTVGYCKEKVVELPLWPLNLVMPYAASCSKIDSS